MRYLLFLLLGLAAQEAGARVIYLYRNNDGSVYKHDPGAQPGDTIMFVGAYSSVYLQNIQGTKEKPVILMNRGLVTMGGAGNYGLIIAGSRHFILRGDGDTAHHYGIRIYSSTPKYLSHGFTFAGSQEFEAHHLEIYKTKVGVFSNPTEGGPYRNIRLHHFYIHHTGNPEEQGRSEAVYIGHTASDRPNFSGRFENVEVGFFRCDSLSGDGIQLASVQGANVHDNVITNYGRADLKFQRSGILFGCTSGRIVRNLVTNGSGAGLDILGAGMVHIEGNTLRNTARAENQDAVYINGKCKTGPRLQVVLTNNTVEKASRNLVFDESKSVVRNKGNRLKR
ncbi:MAG TPA: hypothetical protein VHK69_04310 [Chitinophagaceae bacterium]|jgi:hypothetical protein|nr:hypothetical protein [Chitinophagaceae bacterium]